MKKYLYFLVTIITFVVLMSSVDPVKNASAAEEFEHKPHSGLMVNATEKIKVKPDVAYINICAETKNIDIENAQSENTKCIQNLIAALTDLNLSQEDIKTSSFFIYPEYDYSYGQKFTGYKVSNQLRVKTKDIDNIGKIIDKATENGANIISGVEFSIEDYSIAYKDALIKAVNSAKEKAEELSKAVGAENIKIISLIELPNYYSGCVMPNYAKTFDSAAVLSPIMHGEIEISATVQLKYEMIF